MVNLYDCLNAGQCCRLLDGAMVSSAHDFGRIVIKHVNCIFFLNLKKNRSQSQLHKLLVSVETFEFKQP